MALQNLPAKPAQGSNWINFGDVLYANMAELVTDFPAVRTDINTLQTTKAPLNNPTFTGTVTVANITGVTASMVGLGNVDNTSDATKTFTAAQIASGTISMSRLTPGTVLRCPWNGTAWTYAGAALSSRPSARTDIYFELVGAPAATADPAWMLDGDTRIDL